MNQILPACLRESEMAGRRFAQNDRLVFEFPGVVNYHGRFPARLTGDRAGISSPLRTSSSDQPRSALKGGQGRLRFELGEASKTAPGPRDRGRDRYSGWTRPNATLNILPDSTRSPFFHSPGDTINLERLPVRSKLLRSRRRFHIPSYMRRIRVAVTSNPPTFGSATSTPGIFGSHRKNLSRTGFRQTQNRIRDLHTCSSRLNIRKMRS